MLTTSALNPCQIPPYISTQHIPSRHIPCSQTKTFASAHNQHDSSILLAHIPYPLFHVIRLSLAASAPDILQQTISLCQSVQRVVGLAHCANETAESVDLALTGEATRLIDLSNGDLNGCVVLGLDNSVGSAALSWDVAVDMLC